MAKKTIYIPLDKFNGGVNKLLDEARIGLNEAKEATNLVAVQDGLWKPRWGTGYYGADFGANPDGSHEYVKSDATTELITIAGGKAYKSTNGGSATELSGATFTAGEQCYFLQIASYLYIANGTDKLARYNGTTLSTYSSIAAPTNLAATASGMTGSQYTYYAQVTSVNDVGESTGSTEASVTCSKPRDNWVSASDYITWTWTVASGTYNRHQLYVGDETGDEHLLADTTASSFKDDGTLDINTYIEPPLSNTTTAPKFKDMCLSGNRVWATNDPDNKYTVYFSGTGTRIGQFSDFYGGGWVNLERGGREMPTSVKHYQSGQGQGIATVLCRTPEGKGAVWQIDISTATVGDTSFAVPSAVKVVGSSGTDSQLSVTADNNNIWFFNRRGMFTLGPEKNFYGILRTNELSSRIRPYIQGLVGSVLNGVCAYYYDAKIFFSIPTAGTTNNRIIYYDTERTNWVVDWSIGAKSFFEYTDTSGNSHFMYVPNTGNKLIEISSNIQGDLGSAFPTSYISGRYPLNKIWKDFMKVKKVFIKLGSPRGVVNFTVAGTGRSTPFSSVGTATISSLISMTGMGYDPMGSIEMGDTAGLPTTFADTSDTRYVKIRKKIRDIQFQITTNSLDADYTLLNFLIEGIPLKTKPPTSWRISN